MIYSIGEMLIDFMQEDKAFIPYPGGAPANVAIHAKRAGSKSQFVGKISTDSMGNLLKNTLIQDDVYFNLELSNKPTALALVSHVNGERSFQFYRKDTADLHLSIEDINAINFQENDILHLCSLGLVPDGTTYQAHLHAIKLCKKHKGIISFDVNLRERLWEDLEIAKERILSTIAYSDIVKVNEEELEWLSETSNINEGLNLLQTKNQTIICTLGSEGSIALLPNKTFIRQNAYKTSQVDTTGAGDSYIAIILHKLDISKKPYEEWISNDLPEAMKYASYISSKVVEKQGATPKIKY